MKRLALFVALAVFILTFCGLAQAQSIELERASVLTQILKRGEFRVGLEAGYMPFEMRNKKGQIIGFDVDMVTAMAKAMKVKLTLVNTAWDGIIPSLVTKKFDLIASGMTITQERNLKINFADPYITVGQTILLNKKHEGKVNSYKDLNDPKFKISTKLGTTGDFATQKYIPKATRIAFETEQEAAMEVVKGKADAFIYDHPFNAIYNARNPGKLVFLDKPFTYEPLAWAVRKGDPDFLNWLNNFIRQVRGDGTYDAIYAKWFLSNEWLKELK
ncbi:MAG: transporter substrate-binding domain-containing protein [Deltaproteobacteria bacterium]|nr:transporter substrate-binding domain-containing protein [Deltaproteobacteria bacterium]